MVTGESCCLKWSFSLTLCEIPWHFSSILPNVKISLTLCKIPWQFPDLEKFYFSLTFPWWLWTVPGTQCTTVTFTFLMYSVFFSIEHWASNDLTEAIHRDTLLHTRHQQLLYREQEHVYLQHNDFPTNLNIFSLNLQVLLYAHMFYGGISQDPIHLVHRI